eukprot:SAG31_NODE_13162_length_889_cov_0.648101_1_plen_44_part_10
MSAIVDHAAPGPSYYFEVLNLVLVDLRVALPGPGRAVSQGDGWA